jgi:2-dehydro-3-deoxyphosphogluconate aldolase/(4S)-4-hydroxy-2-oxoglutarate aldolase
MLPLLQILESTGVLPVLSVASAESCVAICEALQRGGITAVEITLRTPAALQAIRLTKQRLPTLVVAAGTVTTVSDMRLVKEAGADFAVSPGMTDQLVQAAEDLELAFLPGVATPSEIMRGRELGIEIFKLFPATVVGGTGLLNAIAGPLPDVRFCPTGGLSLENMQSFLQLKNVLCVGGSWLCPADAVARQDWAAIEAIARRTMAHL